jgi:hypothetical protein
VGLRGIVMSMRSAGEACQLRAAKLPISQKHSNVDASQSERV